MREPTNDEQRFVFLGDANTPIEIAPKVLRLMKIGGFATFDEYMDWTRTPLDDWDEPDWGELALREMGCFESGFSDDNDPGVLEDMQEYAEWYLQEKEDRLIRNAIAAIPSCPPRIPLPERGHRSRRWHRSYH